MDNTRAGETSATHFRTERYFCSNGEWYFLTRGGGQEGPYLNKEEMEGELLLYLREQNLVSSAISN